MAERQHTAQAATDERLHPAGWRVVAAEELGEHLRSARFVILLALLGLTAVATVYAVAGDVRDAIAEAEGPPGAVFLRVFTLQPDPRVPSFFALVGFLAPLLGIAFAFDAVNGERSQGTLPRLLAQPVHRDEVLVGKVAASLTLIAAVLVALTMVVAGVGLLRLGVVPTGAEVARLAVFVAVTVVYVAFWLALALLCSVALRRAATSALAAIGGWLLLTSFATVLAGLAADAIAPPGEDPLRNARTELALGRLSPTALYQEATVALLNPAVRTVGVLLPAQVDRALAGDLPLEQSLLLVWPQLVGLVGVTVVLMAVAAVRFLRQEVRA